MKKFLALMMIMVMVFSMAACGGSEEPAVDDENYIGGELNLLCWSGYEEEPVVKAFEEKYGVKVNYKVFPTSSEMYAMLETAEPGEWDVCTPDTPWIPKMVEAGMLQPLDMDKYPAVNDFFDKWKNFEEVKVDGEQYAIVSHWGYYGIAYNTDYVTEEEASSMDILWDEKFAGKVGIYDWYLPNMEMISSMIGATDKPATYGDEHFAEINDVLGKIAANNPVICATASDDIQAMANGSAYVSIAGEWMAITLAAEGYPIDITIPETGCLSWAECVGICADAKNQAAAEAWIDYIISPEAQALLTWADCYHAPVPNKKAADFLTDEQKDYLKIYDEEYAEKVFSAMVDRQIPADEDKWADAWTEFKLNK